MPCACNYFEKGAGLTLSAAVAGFPLIPFETFAAQLQKESKEKDERTNKIKAVAVKAKKELDISRKEVR